MLTFKNDKVGHAAAGFLAAVFGLLAMLVLNTAFDVAGGYTFVPVICGAVAGITKELADWLDNRLTNTTMHGVEFLDFVATTAPGAAISLVYYLAWGHT